MSHRLQGGLEAVGLSLASAKPGGISVDVPPRRRGVRGCRRDTGMDALVPRAVGVRHIQVGVDAGQAVCCGFARQERGVLRGCGGLKAGKRVVVVAVRSGRRWRATGRGEQATGGAERAAVSVRYALGAPSVLGGLKFRSHAVDFLHWRCVSWFTGRGGISDWTGASKLVAGGS